MKYQLANVADFATDERFVDWVVAPTAESEAYWQNWLLKNPHKATTLHEARELVQMLAADGHQEEGDAAVAAIWQRLQGEMREVKPRQASGTKGRTLSFFSLHSTKLQVAASLGILLLFSFFLFNRFQKQTVAYTTAYGQKRSITLPDSSVVTLHANSSIRFEEGWDGNAPRLVQLQGEAYFSVRHQQNDQKFVVQTTNGSEVEVLGTEFDVVSRPSGNRVVLASGKVRLTYQANAAAKQIVLAPGDLVEVTADGKHVVRKQVRTELYTSWKDNKVIFDNTALSTIAQMLEEVYGYKVIIQQEELATQQITATLDDRGVQNILDTISETLGVSVLKKDNTITIGLSNI
ncbi:FecR family protein [Pontibacter sp. CAU 1760]